MLTNTPTKAQPCRIRDAGYLYDPAEPEMRYFVTWACGAEEHLADLLGKAFRPDALIDATLGHGSGHIDRETLADLAEHAERMMGVSQ